MKPKVRWRMYKGRASIADEAAVHAPLLAEEEQHFSSFRFSCSLNSGGIFIRRYMGVGKKRNAPCSSILPCRRLKQKCSEKRKPEIRYIKRARCRRKQMTDLFSFFCRVKRAEMEEAVAKPTFAPGRRETKPPGGTRCCCFVSRCSPISHCGSPPEQRTLEIFGELRRVCGIDQPWPSIRALPIPCFGLALGSERMGTRRREGHTCAC